MCAGYHDCFVAGPCPRFTLKLCGHSHLLCTLEVVTYATVNRDYVLQYDIPQAGHKGFKKTKRRSSGRDMCTCRNMHMLEFTYVQHSLTVFASIPSATLLFTDHHDASISYSAQ
jgi:hypothetical protein